MSCFRLLLLLVVVVLLPIVGVVVRWWWWWCGGVRVRSEARETKQQERNRREYVLAPSTCSTGISFPSPTQGKTASECAAFSVGHQMEKQQSRPIVQQASPYSFARETRPPWSACPSSANTKRKRKDPNHTTNQEKSEENPQIHPHLNVCRTYKHTPSALNSCPHQPQPPHTSSPEYTPPSSKSASSAPPTPRPPLRPH